MATSTRSDQSAEGCEQEIYNCPIAHDGTESRMAHRITVDLGPNAVEDLLKRFVAESPNFFGPVSTEGFELHFDGSKVVSDHNPRFGSVRDRVHRLQAREKETQGGGSTAMTAFALARGDAQPFVDYFLRGGNPILLLFGHVVGEKKSSTIELQIFPELKEMLAWIALPCIALLGAFFLSRTAIDIGDTAGKVLTFSVPLLFVLPIMVVLRILRFLSHRHRARILLENCFKAELSPELNEIREEQLQDALYRIDAAERRKLMALRWLLLGAVCLWFLSYAVRSGNSFRI